MSSTGTASGFRGLGRHEVVTVDELEPVDAYRERILSRVNSLEPIDLGIGEVLGLVLAEDVYSDESMPPFDNSGMDGYAVVAADVAGAAADAPGSLRVVGEVAAGTAQLPQVNSGTAVRIMTGAPMPPGADAVIPVEVTRETNGMVEIYRSPRAGEFVRRTGEDVEPGTKVLAAGRRIRPGDVALLAALGRARVRCIPRPRVVVLSTGNELAPPGQELTPGKIRDANSYMLGALVRQADAVPYLAGIVADDRTSLTEAFDSNAGHADLVIATGGVSAGAYDHVHDVLEMVGDAVSSKVAMQPGMPQVFGHVRGVPTFGLPGNPVSAFVSFEIFVRPAIRVLQGRRDLQRPIVTARLSVRVTSPPHKRSYLRVRLTQDQGRWIASPAGGQGSHLITTLAAADGLAEVPEDRTVVEEGDAVRVHLLVDP